MEEEEEPEKKLVLSFNKVVDDLETENIKIIYSFHDRQKRSDVEWYNKT